MAEGGVGPKGGVFMVEKAWERLSFQTRDKESTYGAEATNFIEPCKLQFVLKSDLASPEFYKRIGKRQIFKILSREHVGVEVDSSELADIDRFWSSLYESVNRALQSKAVRSFTFLSKNELETALLYLDEYTQRLIISGVVGVYYTYANTSCEAKFVGSDYDTRNMREQICEIMKKKLVHEHQFKQRQIKAMLGLGVAVDLKEGFKDVVIQVVEDRSVVRFQGFEKGRIDDCLSDLKVLIGRLKFIPLDFLSNSAQELLRNENVRKYIEEKVRDERIAFVTEDQHDYFVCRKQENIIELKSSIQHCLMEMNIDPDCLQSAQGKDFFEKHGNEIIRKDHGEKTVICFTLDLKEEVEKLLSSFGKPCSCVVRDFLQTFGTNLLKNLADTHHVTPEIQQDYVCFKGQYYDCKNAMDELERHLEISVLHFDYDEGRLLSSQKRQQLDAIGKRYRCSINAVTFLQDSPTIRNKSDTGIEYLAKWKLHRNKGQVSVTEVDFEKANLDGLIIPVNECMIGEDIFGKEHDERSYCEYCRSQDQKFELGQWEPLHIGNKYRGTSCVALVAFGIAIVDNKQIHCTIGSKLVESVREIIHDSFSRGVWKIGFAIPSSNLDFKSTLKDILSGYQDVVDEFRSQQESELLLCVKQSTEWWLQEVDYCLRWAVCTRRQVGPRYHGLFDKPNVNIKVTRKSLLEVKTNCLVVAISPDLDLSKGHVSKLISEACGEKLQQELSTKCQHEIFRGELFAVESFNLSKQGVKKLIFVSLPFWKRNKDLDHILENCVEESLLLAESYGCSSVAFPVLGTGKLAFPLRDAVVALIDGIDRYVAETTVGNISNVYIAVPDDTTAEILDLELKRRKANSDLSVEQSQIEGQTYLFAEDGNVKFYIANETTSRAFSFGRQTEVFFTSVADKSVNMQKDLTVSERIMKTCENSKDGLQSAFKEVIYMCEKERITNVAVHCCNNFSFSETDQIHAILLAAQLTVHEFNVKDYPVRDQYKYLKHVTMVTSIEGYSRIRNHKLADDKQSKTTSWPLNPFKSSLFKSSPKTDLKWREVCLQVPKTFINVILAGSVDRDLKKAKQDIVKLCTTTDISIDLTEFTDEVTAELNPGLVMYLKNFTEPEFDNWKHSLNKAYGVMLKESESCNNLLITGLFDDILKTEFYLENEFPSLPGAVNMQFEEQSKKNDNRQQVKFTIPVQNKDKIRIFSFFFKELEAVLREHSVKEYCSNGDGISIECLQSVKDDVASGVKQLISYAKGLHGISVPLSPVELRTLMQRDKPDDILYEADESTCTVQIIGRNRDLVSREAKKICLDLKKERNKRHDPFLYKRANLRFEHLDVVVSHEDITDSIADCIVSPVNELMNHEFGVAKEIAKKAGSQYLKECQTVLKQIKRIDLTQCVNTEPGNLKNKHVLLVHTPVKFDQERNMEQLSQITESVRHCLEKAEQLKATSVAFPFVCAGLSGIPVELCAQQYFRALEHFKPQEHLREVKFMDIKEESVSRVCQTMTECMKPDDINISQTFSEINVNGTDVFIGKGQIHAVLCGVIVLSVDEKLHDNDGALKDILTLTNQKFHNSYDDEKKREHPSTSVLSLKSDEGLTNNFVLFAVTPVWNADPNSYAHLIRITTQHILEKTLELQQSDLALPVLCNSEDAEVLNCCCQAMAESFLDFGKKNRNKIKMIHFLTKQSKAVSAMCRAMAVELRSVSGCAGSVAV